MSSAVLNGKTKIVNGSLVGMEVLQITVTDLTAAAVSQVFSLGNPIPANSFIIGVGVDLATPVSGGTIASCVINIGPTANSDELIDGADVFAAAVNGQASARPLGIAPNRFYASATQIEVEVVATGDNLVNAVAGNFTTRLYYGLLE